jgi:hypothetical protein
MTLTSFRTKLAASMTFESRVPLHHPSLVRLSHSAPAKQSAGTIGIRKSSGKSNPALVNRTSVIFSKDAAISRKRAISAQSMSCMARLCFDAVMLSDGNFECTSAHVEAIS